MTLNFQKRYLSQLLPESSAPGLVLITGARQTGKTTLARACYPQLEYINLDSLENRSRITRVSAEGWAGTVGRAILDEAQKEPSLFEKLKYAYDAKAIDFSVLLGSSQILLLKKIRETLAGRIKIYELFPFMLGELMDGSTLTTPLLSELLTATALNPVLGKKPEFLFNELARKQQQAVEYLLTWGGMPALLSLPEPERFKWLKDYEYTYLERDLADLARLSDLQPFQIFQKLTALRSAQLLNYSELARDSQISVDTARRYLEYLKLSYQVVLLPPFFHNRTRSLVKTPKIYWLDIGLLRFLSGVREEVTGAIFETLVVGELVKWVRTMQADVEIYFYRTHGGSEVDLVLQTPKGIIAAEIKNRKTVVAKDFQALKKLAQELGQDWLGGLVIYNGEQLIQLSEPDIWAVPVTRLFC